MRRLWIKWIQAMNFMLCACVLAMWTVQWHLTNWSKWRWFGLGSVWFHLLFVFCFVFKCKQKDNRTTWYKVYSGVYYFKFKSKSRTILLLKIQTKLQKTIEYRSKISAYCTFRTEWMKITLLIIWKLCMMSFNSNIS